MAELVANPDAHPETNTVDGYTEKSNANYTTATTGNAASVADSTSGAGVASVQHSLFAGTYYSRRPIFLFDTSSLGAGASISSAVLSIYVVNDPGNANADSDTIEVVSATTASNTALSVGDHSGFGTTSFHSQTLPIPGSSQFYDFTLNASGISNISLTGISKFGLITGRDLSDTAPTGLNQIVIYYAESAQDPYLTVTYTAGGGTVIKDVIYAGIIPAPR